MDRGPEGATVCCTVAPSGPRHFLRHATRGCARRLAPPLATIGRPSGATARGRKPPVSFPYNEFMDEGPPATGYEQGAYAPRSPGLFAALRDTTFRSLRHRNYRRYFLGQIVSFVGSW